MAKNNSDSSVHVRVDEPISKRREVLQTAIFSVELLRRYDHLEAIRHEKAKELARFKKTLRSIHSLLKLVRLEELPMSGKDLKEVRDVRGRKVLVKRRTSKVKSVANKVVKPKRSTVDTQLDALRKKLESL
jgi:hypothetical protein